MKVKLFSNKADIIGIFSAVLCLMHCLLTPFMVLFFHEHQHTHWLRLDYVFLIVGFFAVYHAVKHGVSTKIKTALWGSLAVLSISIILHEHIHWTTYIAYLASFTLIITHLINIFKQHRPKKTRPFLTTPKANFSTKKPSYQ